MMSAKWLSAERIEMMKSYTIYHWPCGYHGMSNGRGIINRHGSEKRIREWPKDIGHLLY